MLHFMFVVFRCLCKIVLCTFESADTFYKLLTDCHNLPVYLCGLLVHAVFSVCLHLCCADVNVQENAKKILCESTERNRSKSDCYVSKILFSAHQSATQKYTHTDP